MARIAYTASICVYTSKGAVKNRRSIAYCRLSLRQAEKRG
nr:MAG TPA_asm: hypothetical protein [Caudoviricetes sp.]